MSDLKNSIPSNAQNMDEVPSYRIVDKKIIFPSIYCFLYHWTNTFDISLYSSPTKGGKPLYKLKIGVKASHWNDVLRESFPTNIQYIAFAVEYHSIVRDEPSEHEPTGRHHFIVTPLHDDNYESAKEENAKHVEEEQKEFAKLINKLNAQLAYDFPAEHKRGEYFKELCEYKINRSKFAKFKLEDYQKREGFVVIDIAFGWIMDDDDSPTQGITLNLNGYKFKPRDAAADLVIAGSQKRRRETLIRKETHEKQKELKQQEETSGYRNLTITAEELAGYRAFLEAEKERTAGRKHLAPEMQPETMPPPEVVAGRYEIIQNGV